MNLLKSKGYRNKSTKQWEGAQERKRMNDFVFREYSQLPAIKTTVKDQKIKQKQR